MKSNYSVRGLKKEKTIGKASSDKAKNLNHTFTGSEIDELQINAIITTQRELDQFISFLGNTRPCLINK